MKRLREGAVMGGFFWGAVFGGLVALFGAPRLRPAEQIKQVQEGVREKLEAVVPSDPIDQSIAEGKAAARRRLAEISQPPALPQ
jgi:gas vesicle protein